MLLLALILIFLVLDEGERRLSEVRYMAAWAAVAGAPSVALVEDLDLASRLAGFCGLHASSSCLD
jgi:hypothetical protein